MSEYKDLYEKAKAVDPDEALRMALEAKSTEEKSFFTFIASMNLHRRAGEEVQNIVDHKE